MKVLQRGFVFIQAFPKKAFDLPVTSLPMPKPARKDDYRGMVDTLDSGEIPLYAVPVRQPGAFT